MNDDVSTRQELDYRRIAGLIWGRKLLMIACFVLAAGAAFGVSKLQSPTYQASARMIIKQTQGDTLFDASGSRVDSQSQDRRVKTAIKVMGSRPIREAVVAELGPGVPAVTGNQDGTTDVVNVTATSTDPQKAADAANAYAKAYIDFARTQSVNDVLLASAEVGTKVQELQTRLDEIDAQIAALPPASSQLTDIRTERSQIAGQQNIFQQKLDQLQVEGSLRTGGAQLVEEANPPGGPIAPLPKRNAALGGFLGLLIGGALALLLDQLDDVLRGQDDVEAVSGGLPVLGTIPAVEHWDDRSIALVAKPTREEQAASEAYRSLRTSVLFLGLDNQLRSIQFTSPMSGEGKSTSAANLAVALAQAGTRVVLLDCDLRRPRLHQFFDLTNERGFTSVLLGVEKLQDVVQDVTSVQNLKLVASGPIPTNPSELLLSDRAADVLTLLQSHCDVLIIDSPPTLPVTDAVALSKRVQATIVVTSANRSTRKGLRRTLDLLRQVDAPVIGTVVNRIPVEASGRYGYGYGKGGYGYGAYGGYGDSHDDDNGKAGDAGDSNGGNSNGNGHKPKGRVRHTVDRVKLRAGAGH